MATPLSKQRHEQDQSELDDIFRQAAEIRAADAAKLRRRFDLLPEAVQYALFYPEQGGAGGQEARAKREAGNERFRAEQYVDALELFEQALRQVWFVALKPGAPSWRTGGVRDEHIDVTCSDAGEAALCLLNAASCLLKLKQWSECADLCSAALLHATQAEMRAKALYRGACAKQGRRRAGDEDEAIRDLERALRLHALGGKVQQALEHAKAKRLLAIAQEEKMFAGVLDRGDLYKLESTTQEQREAAAFGVDLSDPRVRAAVAELQREDPQNVEEINHEAKRRDKAERFVRTCRVLAFLVLATFGVAHFVIKQAALHQRKFPAEWASLKAEL